MRTAKLAIAGAMLLCGCAHEPSKMASDAPSHATSAASASRAATRISATAPATLPVAENTVRRPSIDRAIADGVAFLVKAQQPDGSWGTGLETRGTEIYSMVPGSHDAYRVGTSALCVMALREAIAAGAGDGLDPAVLKEAHEKGVQYLVQHGDARRDDGSIIYNTWAHTFALQALCDEMKHDSDPQLASAARDQMDRLNRYATHTGGWNYYDFNAQTQQVSLGATSFGTAAGLVALWEAKQAGVEIPPNLAERSVRRLEECRLPNGVFMYGADYKYIPRIPANMVRGAIGRTQPANYALWLWGSKIVGEPQAVDGLELFFKEHVALDMGRKRPYPHEAWYQTSGYYYYYDHYYAGRLLEKLTAANRQKFAPQLAEQILPHQEADGSWWDYAMWDYHKPYGTAFAVMTLLRCK
ncbi:hypothetical protein BH09PLA1_BH09PLA1_33200 [soil metagenome]